MKFTIGMNNKIINQPDLSTSCNLLTSWANVNHIPPSIAAIETNIPKPKPPTDSASALTKDVPIPNQNAIPDTNPPSRFERKYSILRIRPLNEKGFLNITLTDLLVCQILIL